MQENSREVLVKHRRIKASFGLYEHWFYDVPSIQVEIHPGLYRKGTHLQHGTTKNSLTYMKIDLCNECFTKFAKLTCNMADMFYYPVINCETLASFSIGGFPLSIQMIATFAFLVTGVFIIIDKKFLYLMILLLIVYLFYLNYLSTVTYTKKCKHLLNLH